MATIPPDSIDCIWTDPPYLLSNDGVTCVAGKRVSVNKGEWDRSGGVDSDHTANLIWLRACHRILKPAGAIWITGTLHIYLSVGMALQQLGFRILNDIIWEKPNPPPNLGARCFTHSSEVILWATKAPKGSKHRHTFNYEEMRAENGGKQMKSVWRFLPPGADEKRHGKHPTQKPVALIDRCIRASTHPGDVVLDPFAGTAATGVAALKNGRNFIGIEQNLEFAEIGMRRLMDIDAGSTPVTSCGQSASPPPRTIVPKPSFGKAQALRQEVVKADCYGYRHSIAIRPFRQLASHIPALEYRKSSLRSRAVPAFCKAN